MLHVCLVQYIDSHFDAYFIIHCYQTTVVSPPLIPLLLSTFSLHHHHHLHYSLPLHAAAARSMHPLLPSRLALSRGKRASALLPSCRPLHKGFNKLQPQNRHWRCALLVPCPRSCLPKPPLLHRIFPETPAHLTTSSTILVGYIRRALPHQASPQLRNSK